MGHRLYPAPRTRADVIAVEVPGKALANAAVVQPAAADSASQPDIRVPSLMILNSPPVVPNR